MFSTEYDYAKHVGGKIAIEVNYDKEVFKYIGHIHSEQDLRGDDLPVFIYIGKC